MRDRPTNFSGIRGPRFDTSISIRRSTPTASLSDRTSPSAPRESAEQAGSANVTKHCKWRDDGDERATTGWPPRRSPTPRSREDARIALALRAAARADQGFETYSIWCASRATAAVASSFGSEQRTAQ